MCMLGIGFTIGMLRLRMMWHALLLSAPLSPFCAFFRDLNIQPRWACLGIFMIRSTYITDPSLLPSWRLHCQPCWSTKEVTWWGIFCEWLRHSKMNSQRRTWKCIFTSKPVGDNYTCISEWSIYERMNKCSRAVYWTHSERALCDLTMHVEQIHSQESM